MSEPQTTRVDFRHAAPFWLSLGVVPLVLLSAAFGGWAILLPIAGTWWLFTLLDRILGHNTDNPDPTGRTLFDRADVDDDGDVDLVDFATFQTSFTGTR